MTTATIFGDGELMTLDAPFAKEIFQRTLDRISENSGIQGNDLAVGILLSDLATFLQSIERYSNSSNIPTAPLSLFKKLDGLSRLKADGPTWLRRNVTGYYELAVTFEDYDAAAPDLGPLREFVRQIDHLTQDDPQLIDRLQTVRERVLLTRIITDWNLELNVKQAEFDELKKFIDNQKSSLNFVLLNKAFGQMRTSKEGQLSSARTNMQIFGVLMFIPVMSHFIYSMKKDIGWSWNLLATAVPALSLTILLLYFFRISLRNVDSIKSQILQLELREALCQFIQGYADYAGPIQTKHPDMLAKFESLVFSSIVASDEKIPSTFDGVEQVANLIKAVQGK